MTTLYSPPHLTCPHCEGPARVVTNGLCERCREEDRLRAALSREKERADRAEARLDAAAKVSPMCAENTDLRARAERAEAALRNLIRSVEHFAGAVYAEDTTAIVGEGFILDAAVRDARAALAGSSGGATP